MRTGLMLLEALRREMHSEKHASTLNEFVIKKMHWIKAIEDIQYLFNKAADEAALLSSSESTSEQVNMYLDDNACGYHDGIDIQNLRTITETAVYLGVTERTIYNYVQSNRLTPIRLGKKTLFDVTKLGHIAGAA